jgi:hypothetical protein
LTIDVEPFNKASFFESAAKARSSCAGIFLIATSDGLGFAVHRFPSFAFAYKEVEKERELFVIKLLWPLFP